MVILIAQLNAIDLQ